jgi:hypothetical protein
LAPCASRTAYGPCETCPDVETCPLQPVLQDGRDAIAAVFEARTLLQAAVTSSPIDPTRKIARTVREVSEDAMQDFLLFLAVGFLAQIVDGALGMAYGVISSTVLLSFGVPPATASASVHAAEVFTTAASAGSHTVNKNVNWKLFVPLALGGVVGGGFGAFVLTSIDGDLLKPFITTYLAIMGVVIIWRATRQTRERIFPRKFAGPLGLVGGFFDAIGGGGGDRR